MLLIINGTDITSYIKESGMDYSREEVRTQTVTTMDGVDHSHKVRDRVVLTFSFIPMTRAQLNSILALFSGDSLTVKYYDLYTGSDRTMSATSDARKASFLLCTFEGVELYDGLSITLKEC